MQVRPEGVGAQQPTNRRRLSGHDPSWLRGERRGGSVYVTLQKGTAINKSRSVVGGGDREK